SESCVKMILRRSSVRPRWPGGRGLALGPEVRCHPTPAEQCEFSSEIALEVLELA
ncbi:hypothetical protein AVEN_219562-1, partial [Araneus ventricosus]